MDTLNESMARFALLLQGLGERGKAPPFYVGEVLQAGQGRLQVRCGGLTLGPEDLYLAVGLSYQWTWDNGSQNYLRRGDRVILLSQDGQDYYLLTRMVRA